MSDNPQLLPSEVIQHISSLSTPEMQVAIGLTNSQFYNLQQQQRLANENQLYQELIPLYDKYLDFFYARGHGQLARYGILHPTEWSGDRTSADKQRLFTLLRDMTEAAEFFVHKFSGYRNVKTSAQDMDRALKLLRKTARRAMQFSTQSGQPGDALALIARAKAVAPLLKSYVNTGNPGELAQSEGSEDIFKFE